MQSMPISACFLTVSATAGMTSAAMVAGSVISAVASRAGISSHPLGGGSRPTCDVLIRVTLRCMLFLLTLVYHELKLTSAQALFCGLSSGDFGSCLVTVRAHFLHP